MPSNTDMLFKGVYSMPMVVDWGGPWIIRELFAVEILENPKEKVAVVGEERPSKVFT